MQLPWSGMRRNKHPVHHNTLSVRLYTFTFVSSLEALYLRWLLFFVCFTKAPTSHPPDKIIVQSLMFRFSVPVENQIIGDKATLKFARKKFRENDFNTILKSKWDSWLSKWRWDRFSSDHFRFLLSASFFSFHPLLCTYSLTHHRHYIISKIASVVK